MDQQAFSGGRAGFFVVSIRNYSTINHANYGSLAGIVIAAGSNQRYLTDSILT